MSAQHVSSRDRPSSTGSSARPTRRRAAAVAATVVALGVAAPSALAAAGVFKGTGADAVGDAPSNLDILGADVAYGQKTGALRTTVRVGSRPPGDVDVLVGTLRSNGACGIPFVTLNSNVAAGTGEWRGSSGKAHAKAKVTYTNGIIVTSVTDPDLKGRTPSCAIAMSYGAGSARPLRDTLPAFEVTDRATDPGTPGGGGGDAGGGDGTGGTGGEDLGGIDTDGDGIPDDFDGDGLPDDLDGDGVPDVLAGMPGTDGSTDGSGGGEAGGGSGADVSARVYGVPKRAKRGRSYDVRVRLRNDGTEDATSLRVRLSRRAGVAMSRRVARVSRVRSGKGVTVHFRVRLKTKLPQRTIRVTVSGEGVRASTSFKLRRRGA